MIPAGNRYFEKHAFFPAWIKIPAPSRLFLSVVIPCYQEPHLIRTLDSLLKCKPPSFPAEVLIVINESDKDSDDVIRFNRQTAESAQQWIQSNTRTGMGFHIIRVQFPARHAGVGWARKTGMDEAALRFESVGRPEGVIVCLDADCTVSSNYLTELENHFLKNPKSDGCCLYFEHAISGNEFSREVYSAILDYELYLRLYHAGLQYSGFPYSLHTVGSCMAVRSNVYMRSGGMNRRKAGEDFYFLHKIFPAAAIHPLHTACVYPSPRPSLRVPFGTGSTVNKVLTGQHCITAFNMQSFEDFKTFNSLTGFLFENDDCSKWICRLPESMNRFLKRFNTEEKIREIRENSTTRKNFISRFYRWFDGLMSLQYFHYCRDHFYPDMNLTEAGRLMAVRMNLNILPGADRSVLLEKFRQYERTGNGQNRH